MAIVKAVDGKIRLIDNTDAVLFENSATAAAATITAPSTLAVVTVATSRFGYNTQAQADAISMAVKKLVTIVKNAKLAT